MSVPTGEVTFLFSDIEGSTRLWEHLPEAMNRALVRHDMVVRHAIESHGGYVFKTVGDQFCASFSTAHEGIAAAVAAQIGLLSQKWGDELTIRVRMALHTGSAQERLGDYFGTTVNRVARLLSIGHGGQILVSGATEAIARDALPASTELLDLGEHRLKDLQHAEHVFQISHPQLPNDLPPLASIRPESNNLPVQLTSFIGREKELSEVKGLLATTRLLSLTGSGGCGKTRLSLQAAADVLEEFRDGVWQVEFAPLTDGDLVAQTVASVLGVRETPGKPVMQALVDFCKPKSLLLILDNCEHVVQSCATLANTLLRACPGMKIMATSREALAIPGELNWRVPSLVPLDPKELRRANGNAVSKLTQNEAAKLFIERATAAMPTFILAESNVVAVAQVCHRLDGIPLAIELAAARVRVLPVEQIAERLDDRFRLLTGGDRSALPRQQTLRALIDWSYDLLTEPEKSLIRRLSVFSGGWTLAASEAVCVGGQVEEWEVLDLLSQLVDKSLVIVEDEGDEARYRLLQTVRQYGRDRLQEAGEADDLQAKHQRFYSSIAEGAAPQLQGPEQTSWLDRLEAEHDNLRSAFDFALEAEPDEAVRLSADLWRFWLSRCFFTEGRDELRRALDIPGLPRRSKDHARALQGAGVLALTQNEYPAATAYLEECIEVSRAIGLQSTEAAAINSLGNVAWRQGDYPRAKELYAQSLELERKVGNDSGIARALISLGNVATQQAEYDSALTLYEEALVLSRKVKNSAWEAATLHNLGDVAWSLGDYEKAGSYYEQGLDMWRALGDRLRISRTLNKLGDVAAKKGEFELAQQIYEDALRATRELGDRMWEAISLACLGDLERTLDRPDTALDFYRQSLAIRSELDDKWGIASCLTGIANLLAATGRETDAARIYGASEALREQIGAPLPPVDRESFEQGVGDCKTAIGDGPFLNLWAEGDALQLPDVIAAALESRS